jgi:uncharacterized membrane protein
VGPLLLQVAFTCYLTGLIWTIQLVHYPLMAQVGPDHFSRYERLHAAAITPVVGPAMLAEAGLAAWLLLHRPTAVPAWMAWTGAALVLLIWIVTFGVSVPCHGVLSQGFNAAAHERLVQTNWIRTLGWTARAALCLWMTWLAWRAVKS